MMQWTSIRAGWWITLLSYFVPRKVSLFRKLQISQSGIMVQIHHRISIPRKMLILAWGNNMKVSFLLKDCKKQRYSQQRVVNWCLQEIFILTGCPKPICIVPVIHTTAAGCCLAIHMGYCPSVRSRWLDIGQNWRNISCEARRGVPNGKDRPILPIWVGNRSAEFDSSCLLM